MSANMKLFLPTAEESRRLTREFAINQNRKLKDFLSEEILESVALGRVDRYIILDDADDLQMAISSLKAFGYEVRYEGMSTYRQNDEVVKNRYTILVSWESDK